MKYSEQLKSSNIFFPKWILSTEWVVNRATPLLNPNKHAKSTNSSKLVDCDTTEIDVSFSEILITYSKVVGTMCITRLRKSADGLKNE